MESNLCKIFVGNVPFQCDKNEFTNCFEKMQGYVKADIIYKLGTNICRGFGFVTFDSPENAKLLLEKSVSIRDRTLRFTQYLTTLETYIVPDKHVIPMTIESSKNLIIVKNIANMTRMDVYNFFTNFGTVGKHFIMTDHETGISKNYAVVEIIEQDVYEWLLKIKEIDCENNILEISRWKLKKTIKSKPITKYDLANAFVAGKKIGIIEGSKSNHNLIINK